MLSDKIFIFDIETVPNIAAARRLLDMHAQNEDEVFHALENYHIQISKGNSFFRQMFWLVACISGVEAEIVADEDDVWYKITKIRSMGDENSSEKDLVEGFSKYCQKYTPRLVSFNGKIFDIPVLKYRSMYYEIPFSWFYVQEGLQYKKDTYSDKWGDKYHCDLIDFFRANSTGGIKMSEICAMFNIPVKIDNDGGDVYALYKAGQISKIRDYCETDGLVTFILYIIAEYHKGIITKKGYTKSMEYVFSYIKTQCSDRLHLQNFINMCDDSLFMEKFSIKDTLVDSQGPLF